MKRKPKSLATRNPFVVLAMKRKAGTHRKPNKAIRRAEKVNTRALSPATEIHWSFSRVLCPGGVMAAALVLETSVFGRVGSSPTWGTNYVRTGRQGVCGWLLAGIERGSIPRYGAILMLTLAQW